MLMQSLKFSELPIFNTKGQVSAAKLIRFGRSKMLLAVQHHLLISDNPIEHLYWHRYELTSYPKCSCGNDITNFISLTLGYKTKFCSRKCMVNDSNIKAKKISTMMSTYGEAVSNPSQLSHINAKKQATNRQSLGVDWPSQSPAVQAKIKAGYKQIDPKTGKTKGQLRADKIRATRERLGYQLPFEQMAAYDQYTSKVLTVTAQQALHTLPRYNLRKRNGKDPHQLDHRFSMMEGFKQGISPEIIGCIHNLAYIPMRENHSKGARCSITLTELLAAINLDEKVLRN